VEISGNVVEKLKNLIFYVLRTISKFESYILNVAKFTK
jgi:hypothetical protein